MKRSFPASLIAMFLVGAIAFSACQNASETSVSETISEVETTTVVETEETEATTTQTEETGPIDPALLEYSLVWEENFDGDELDRDIWSVERHSPYWVNNEMQAYVDSEECIFVEDGDLVIQPVRVVDEETGEVSYQSGRINSRGGAEFQYGRIEARIKVPEGQGYLPAFWMMSRSESFGSWPRSGEIDIMEVLGSETDTTYGTIHFGNPHEERQSRYTLDSGSFSSEYHVFSIEWEPGLIIWYVDDIEIGRTSDWFTGATPTTARPYPAPFNKPFYIIFNVAVGGNWPGDPDSTTPFDERAQMRVDWVRVYQRGYYDENVEAPEVSYNFRYPDLDGNFVDPACWDLYLAEGGAGELSMDGNELTVTSTDCGTVDYGVQLVQTGLPAQDGHSYTVTFEARADEARTMIAAVTAPDHGYERYLEDEEVSLTSEWQTFTYTFTMDGISDDNARLEFNMGNTGSTATVYLRNVTITEAS